jgi:hypothetical protein
MVVSVFINERQTLKCSLPEFVNSAFDLCKLFRFAQIQVDRCGFSLHHLP